MIASGTAVAVFVEPVVLARSRPLLEAKELPEEVHDDVSIGCEMAVGGGAGTRTAVGRNAFGLCTSLEVALRWSSWSSTSCVFFAVTSENSTW